MNILKLIPLAALLGLAFVTPNASAQPAPPPDPITGVLGYSDGQQLYENICLGCHMPGGKGAVGGGAYPAFVDNPRLVSADYMAATILNGRSNMPSFAEPTDWPFWYPPTWLTDTQVANVINYIRSHFGNAYTDAITPEQVNALRPAKPAEAAN
ncbi:MAG: cytochrome c [Lysobacteraceae bacterium]